MVKFAGKGRAGGSHVSISCCVKYVKEGGTTWREEGKNARRASGSGMKEQSRGFEWIVVGQQHFCS
jgi:hypothetical protein